MYFPEWKVFYFDSNFIEVENKPALVQIMAWRRIGDKLLFELMATQFTEAYMWHCGEMSSWGPVATWTLVLTLPYCEFGIYLPTNLLVCTNSQHSVIHKCSYLFQRVSKTAHLQNKHILKQLTSCVRRQLSETGASESKVKIDWQNWGFRTV